jgi:hypothetical protein
MFSLLWQLLQRTMTLLADNVDLSTSMHQNFRKGSPASLPTLFEENAGALNAIKTCKRLLDVVQGPTGNHAETCCN